MTSQHGPLQCRLESLPAGAGYEFIAYPQGVTTLHAAGWPCVPGAIRRGDGAVPLLMHFAPRRWLAPAAHPQALAAMQAAEEAGAGICVVVDGKWSPLRLSGVDAARALASTADVAAILEGRECAATTLFDCPAIVMRLADGYALWLLASYAEDFIAAIARLHGAVTTSVQDD